MNKIKDYFKVAPALNYFLRVFKKDKEGKFPSSINLKLMHGINRISIVMFSICVLVLIYRYFIRGY